MKYKLSKIVKHSRRKKKKKTSALYKYLCLQVECSENGKTLVHIIELGDRLIAWILNEGPR